MADRCRDCDLPLATDADYEAFAEDEGEHLCWRAWHADECQGERVDWQGRALAAERLCVALWDRQCAAKAPCNQGDDHEALRAQVEEMRKRRGGGG